MEDDAVDYVRQILEALRFMHERNVVHLDLKVGGTDFLSHWATVVPFSLTMNLLSLFPAISRILGSIHTYPAFLETEIIFVRFSLPLKQKRRFRAPAMPVFKYGAQSLEKTPASRLPVPDGLKRGFLNSMRSYIHTTSMCMLCKGCYRISIILAFSYGRAKTVQIRHVRTHFFENGIKKSLFFKQYLDTRGHPSPDGLALETCF